MCKVQRKINPAIAFLSLTLLTFWIEDFLSSVTVTFPPVCGNQNYLCRPCQMPLRLEVTDLWEQFYYISDFAYSWMICLKKKKKKNQHMPYLFFLFSSPATDSSFLVSKRWQGYKVRQGLLVCFTGCYTPAKLNPQPDEHTGEDSQDVVSTSERWTLETPAGLATLL